MRPNGRENVSSVCGICVSVAREHALADGCNNVISTFVIHFLNTGTHLGVFIPPPRIADCRPGRALWCRAAEPSSPEMSQRAFSGQPAKLLNFGRAGQDGGISVMPPLAFIKSWAGKRDRKDVPRQRPPPRPAMAANLPLRHTHTNTTRRVRATRAYIHSCRQQRRISYPYT